MRLCAFQRSHSLPSLLPVSVSSCSRCCRVANTSSAKAHNIGRSAFLASLRSTASLRDSRFTLQALPLIEREGNPAASNLRLGDNVLTINSREVGLAFYLPTSESHREPDTVTVPIL